jgi:anti-sigma factor RsiW
MTNSHQDDAALPGLAHIDCEATIRRLWDYLDGRLPDMARAEVEEHLATCAYCAPHFVFARTMQGAIAASTPPATDSEEDRLRERVRAALRRLADDSQRSDE